MKQYIIHAILWIPLIYYGATPHHPYPQIMVKIVSEPLGRFLAYFATFIIARHYLIIAMAVLMNIVLCDINVMMVKKLSFKM
jgi:hypothetical protein